MRIILFFLFLVPTILSAQKLSNNEVAMDLAQRSLDKMYNFETAESISLARQLEKELPAHPAASFLYFLNVYWNSVPGENEAEDNDNMFKHLKETLSKAEKLMEKDKNNEEGVFFALAAHGYLSQYYADENSNIKALKEAKNAYSFMKTGFNLLEKNPEFYYTTGMYNYYREQFPESQPGYKPFMWFFASGDKEEGLKQLDRASKDALFTKTEATNFAANIYLRYESSPSKAEKYAAKLVNQFPGNHLYRSLYCETLLSQHKFQHAAAHIDYLNAVNIPYFNFIGDVYQGIMYEKQDKKLAEAKHRYLKVIENSGNIRLKTSHYVSLAYCGLGRISLIEGDKNKAKDYFKKVLNIAYYPSIRQEAENELKKI